MAYSTTSYQKPFWASKRNFARGRDPLGIQNSSISVYSKLLPGLTNLTQRIRYYGFFTWLLDQYEGLDEDDYFKSSTQAQYTFIRRAELIVAFLMVNKHPDEKSVVGSNFANEHIDDADHNTPYDLISGADRNDDGNAKYWKYSSGAFGQYYSGSLQDLALIHFEEGFYKRTEPLGLYLAKAYDQSISKSAKENLLSSITEGKLWLKDLDILNDFALNKKLIGTEEGKIYLELFLNNDGDHNITAKGANSFQRRDTFSIMLSIINGDSIVENWGELPNDCYYHLLNSNEPEKVNEATKGWYYYQLNELCHYFMEGIFCGLLNLMELQKRTLHDFMKDTLSKIKFLFLQEKPNSDGLTLKEIIDQNESLFYEIEDSIEAVDEKVRLEANYNTIYESLIGILLLYKHNKNHLIYAQDYANDHYLGQKNGNAISIFNRYITPFLENTFSKYAENAIQKVLNDHSIAAYNKFSDGGSSLLKFIIEDNILIHIETMYPSFTTPRLHTVHNMLSDLGLVDDDSLSSEGHKLLKEIRIES